MITNCAAAGATSSTVPITGAITRPDPVTGQPVAAGIKLNGADPSIPPVTHAAETVSLAPDTFSALLAFQQV